MEETASGFVERATRSEMRRVHVLLDGTHCVQQQSGRIPHRATHSLLCGIVSDMIGDPSKKTSDWFQYLLKFRALSVFEGNVIEMTANEMANTKLPVIFRILRKYNFLNLEIP